MENEIQNQTQEEIENFQLKKIIGNTNTNPNPNSTINSQRTIIQSPMKLNPEKFNNDLSTKMQETCRTNRISHENIKDVII